MFFPTFFILFQETNKTIKCNYKFDKITKNPTHSLFLVPVQLSNKTTVQKINMAEDEPTTTVQFIAVSAEEHERMISNGELPPDVQGADVDMKTGEIDDITGLEGTTQVRLIAVDSNGLPVIDPMILQAAAEQAGIQFLIKDTNSGKNSVINIGDAMRISNDPSSKVRVSVIMHGESLPEDAVPADLSESHDKIMKNEFQAENYNAFKNVWIFGRKRCL